MTLNRRNFLKATSLSATPLLFPALPWSSKVYGANTTLPQNVKLYGDGESYEPGDYLNVLQALHAVAPIGRDRYGSGGAVEALEKKFMEITGKERAIYMPSGTMANQLAIAALSGDNTKVFVQETSHVYRDEADAAQSVFNKRLMPLAAGETYFTARQLQDGIDGLSDTEVFQSGIGAVSIENPVRRSDGRHVPLEEIKKISELCKTKNIKLHMDGARIYMASAWTGVPVKEYASYFDTVYISLYKYLGASGGAILCGDKSVIDKMQHLIKIHGGNMYGSWHNAAMALHRLEGIEKRLQDTVARAGEIVKGLNGVKGITINPLPGGTNIYLLKVAKETDIIKFHEKLYKEFKIPMPRPNQDGVSMVTMNETLLYQPVDYVVNAFRKSLS